MTTTTARIEANRANALKSTGPVTQMGKATSSRNARKHGLLSRETLLPNEDADELARFEHRLRADLRPVGELEDLLTDRIVTTAWRVRRILRVEVIAFQGSRRTYAGEMEIGHAFISLSVNGDSFSKLCRYEAALERTFYRALHELQRLQAARTGEPVAPPIAVDVDVTSNAS